MKSKKVQEAVDCIASLWNIKGHQEYALDAACQLGKYFHQEPQLILDEVKAAIGSVTYEELEHEIEDYADWINLI